MRPDNTSRDAELFRRRQMHGVDRANRLHWKRTADARENGVSEADQVASSREDLEPSHRRAFIGRVQAPGRSPAGDGTSVFSKRQGRRDAPPGRAYRCPRTWTAGVSPWGAYSIRARSTSAAM